MFTFVARPSRVRQALILLVGIGFVLLGAWLAGLITPAYPPGREWIGWASMAFFGPISLLHVRRLFETDDIVRIGPSGIWYRLWSDDTIPWNQITKVGGWQHRHQRSLLLSLVDPDRFPSTTFLGRMASANRALTGGDIPISVLGTDRSFDELMAAVAEYQRV